jgi:hypothetical protein
MPSIEIDKSIPYEEAKRMAGALMAQNPLVSSVRILIDKDTHQMRIEYTEFSKKTVDKLL